MKTIKHIIPLIFLFIPLFSFSQEDFEEKLMKQFHMISSEEIIDWVTEMSSDKYKGRLTGTPEYLAVAEWVASKLKSWGVQPGGDDGTYFQWFDRPWNELHELGYLALHIEQDDGTVIEKSYSFPDEFFPGITTASGELTAEVIYIGYGVTAPELDYDDYKDIDVKGKIVLMNRDVPYKDARDPEYKKWVKYCYHQEKLNNAVKHGAAGMLYIGGNIANPNISWSDGFVWAGIAETPLNDLFAGTGKTNKSILEGIDKSFKPNSFSLNKNVTIKAKSTWHPDGKGCNVIGVIPGTDPDLKDEVIIIGGHLDGVGFIGDIVLPGAWDNASGIADIMGAAKAMGQSGIELKRSVMFLFIGGEECGLLGSKLYADEPKFQIDKTVCYINLDMVGNGVGIRLGGGASFPGILKHFEDVNTYFLHRNFSSSEVRTHYGRPRSDGASFQDVGIPSLSIGTTGAYKRGYYHHPLDKVETLTPEVMEDVSKLIYISLTKLARDKEYKLKIKN